MTGWPAEDRHEATERGQRGTGGATPAVTPTESPSFLVRIGKRGGGRGAVDQSPARRPAPDMRAGRRAGPLLQPDHPDHPQLGVAAELQPQAVLLERLRAAADSVVAAMLRRSELDPRRAREPPADWQPAADLALEAGPAHPAEEAVLAETSDVLAASERFCAGRRLAAPGRRLSRRDPSGVAGLGSEHGFGARSCERIKRVASQPRRLEAGISGCRPAQPGLDQVCPRGR